MIVLLIWRFLSIILISQQLFDYGCFRSSFQSSTCPSSLVLLVQAQRREYSGDLEPIPFSFHYTTGFIQAPGVADVSDLVFSTPFESDYFNSAKDSEIDILFFSEPPFCSRFDEGSGCDWTSLGIGKKGPYGDILWCCTTEDFENGHCAGPMDRFIVNRNEYKGLTRTINIPGPPEDVFASIQNPLLQVQSQSPSGKYVLLMANCNPNGRLVHVEGTYSFQSDGGYMPPFMSTSRTYYAIMIGLYVLLIMMATLRWGYSPWPWPSLKGSPPQLPGRNRQRHLIVQRTIWLILLFSTSEAIGRTLEFALWNANGNRVTELMFFATVTETGKNTLLRTLLIFLGLGFGVLVAPPTVESSAPSNVPMRQHYIRLFILGFLFFVLSTALSIGLWELNFLTMQAFNSEDDNDFIKATEVGLADVVLSLLVRGLNTLYGIYILATMVKTMEYLQRAHPFSRSMERYRQLRLLLIIAAVIALCCLFFVQFEISEQNNTVVSWLVSNIMEIDYVILVIGITYLWRPIDSEELPLLEGEEEDDYDGQHEFELQGGQSSLPPNTQSATYTPVGQNDLELTDESASSLGVVKT